MLPQGGCIGKNATAMFRGEVYSHPNAASNLLSTMREVINGSGDGKN